MKRFKSMILNSVFLTICLVLASIACQPKLVDANAPNGIAGNGTGGISIDINAAPYTNYANIPTWGKYAYGKSGCAWFASARVNQLTGKNCTIYSGKSWYNSAYASFGFSRGSALNAKALACYENHVTVVESVNGDTAVISEGGAGSSSAANGYCVIRTISRGQLESARNGRFLGYVYLGVQPSGNNPTACLDVLEGGESSVRIAGWAFDRDAIGTPLEIHVYIGEPKEGHGGIMANSRREDVDKAYRCGANHGFDLWIPTEKYGQQEVWVYAINIGSGENIQMGHATVNIRKTTSITFADFNQNAVTEDNGEFYVKLMNPGRANITSVGCYLYDKSGKLLKYYSENCNYTTSYVNFNCNIKNDMKYTLKPGTTYKYILYGVVANGREYRDVERTFTTRTVTPRGSAVNPKKPKNVTGLYVKAGKKKMDVSWNWWTDVSGYQIQYAMNKSFTKEVKTFNLGMYASKKTIKGLKKKKTYYVRVRGFKAASGKRAYGNWSNVMKAKIK